MPGWQSTVHQVSTIRQPSSSPPGHPSPATTGQRSAAPTWVQGEQVAEVVSCKNCTHALAAPCRSSSSGGSELRRVLSGEGPAGPRTLSRWQRRGS